MADQTFDPRLESLLRDALAKEAASLPLTVRADQVLERAQSRRNERPVWRRSLFGQPNVGLLRLSAAVGTVAVLVVAGVVALSTLGQVRPAPAASLPTSPADWSRVQIESPPGTGGITRIAAGPRGLVAVAGPDNNGESRVLFSTDGHDWSLAEHSAVGEYVSVVATQRGFLMLDGDGVWTSQDGLAWQRTFTWSDDPKFTDSIVVDVSAGGPGYVAVGANNRAWYSTDGADWTLAQMPPPPAEFIRPEYPELTVDLLHVAAVGDHLVATGYVYAGNSDTSITKDIVLVSSDGKTWSTVLPDIGDRAGPLQLAARPNGFLVIGGPLDGSDESTVWQSADGETWQAFATNDFNPRSSDANCTPRARMSEVAAAESGYVAVGIEHECMDGDFPASPPQAVIWASEDGQSWSRLPDSGVFTLPDAQDSLGTAAGSVVAWGSRFVVGGLYGGQPAIWISGSGPSVEPTAVPSTSATLSSSATPSSSPSFSASPNPSPSPGASPLVDLGIFEPVAGRIAYFENSALWAVDPNASSPASTLVRLGADGQFASWTVPLGWSSDGTKLLFMRDEVSVGQQPPYDRYLYILHADGTETQVTPEPIGGAAISPDGSRVVFAADGDGLYVVDAEGGEPVRIADEGEEPTFSPDGTQIAYLFLPRSGCCVETGREHVWVANADGTDAHEILADEPALAEGVFELTWSPAGDRIALENSLEVHVAIYTFAPDGSNFTKVINGGFNPYWSPDGSQIAYGVLGRDGLSLADADGSNVRTLDFGFSGPWHPGPLQSESEGDSL